MLYVISFIMLLLMIVAEVLLQNKGNKNYVNYIVLSSKVIKYLSFGVLLVITLWQLFSLGR